MTMIDAETIRLRTDLLAIISHDTTLKKTGSNWWAGACPFCGGKDRFVLHDTGQGWRWLCRVCGDGKYHNVIDYVMKRDSCNFVEACQALGGESYQGADLVMKPKEPKQLTETLPNDADNWQGNAKNIIRFCEAALWSGSAAANKALEYLRQARGLTDETIKKWHLGFSAGDYIGKVYISGGITIPAIFNQQVWYIKIRLIEGVKFRCQNRDCQKVLDKPGPCPFCGEKNKYRGVPGSKAALFGADTLRGKKFALLVEGEFDTILANQEFGDPCGIGVFTLGSQSANFDWLTWGKYLMPIEGIIAAYDSDGSSEKGIQKIMAASDIIHPVVCPRLEKGNKDISDYALAGGNLKAWLLAEFSQLGMDISQLADRNDLADILATEALEMADAARAARESGDFERGNNLQGCFDRFFELSEKLVEVKG